MGIDPTCLLNPDFAVFLKVPVDHPCKFTVGWKICKENTPPKIITRITLFVCETAAYMR